MAKQIFVDTSGFYALLVRNDNRHGEASAALRRAAEARRLFVTTDYVLDETATLLKARGHGHLLESFFDVVFASAACGVEWTDPDRFGRARAFLTKHSDHPWSFTDCLSFCVMKELRIREALTKDAHFAEAGFVALLT